MQGKFAVLESVILTALMSLLFASLFSCAGTKPRIDPDTAYMYEAQAIGHRSMHEDRKGPYDYIPSGSVAFAFQELTREYKFERVGKHEVLRTNQWTGERELLSNRPNRHGEYIHAAEFVRRRLAHRNHKVFLTAKGMEVWFGGGKDLEPDTVDAFLTVVAQKRGVLVSDLKKEALRRGLVP